MILNIHQHIQLIKSIYIFLKWQPYMLIVCCQTCWIYLFNYEFNQYLLLASEQQDFGISQSAPVINTTAFVGRFSTLHCIYNEFELTSQTGTKNLENHYALCLYIHKYISLKAGLQLRKHLAGCLPVWAKKKNTGQYITASIVTGWSLSDILRVVHCRLNLRGFT